MDKLAASSSGEITVMGIREITASGKLQNRSMVTTEAYSYTSMQYKVVNYGRNYTGGMTTRCELAVRIAR